MDNTNEQFPELPMLELGNKEVVNAAKHFVKSKYALDAFNETRYGAPLVEVFYSGFDTHGGFHPFAAAYHFLPFYRYQRSQTPLGQPYMALVPTSMIVGQSWKWSPENLNDETQNRVIQRTHKAVADNNQQDLAQYCYIKPLGIVLAHEGKNRVALFSEKDLPYIPAQVWEEDYPDATRIRIFELEDVCLAVLDNRYVDKVNSLEFIRKLVTAYGVTIEKEWPSEYPALSYVIQSFKGYQFMQYSHSQNLPDLSELAKDEAADNTEVWTALADIENVRLLDSHFFAAALFMLCTSLILMKFAFGWNAMQNFLIFIASITGIFLMHPILPVFKCKVKELKDNPRWSKIREIKHQLQS